MVEIVAQQNGNGTATITVGGSVSDHTNELFYLQVGDQYWHEVAHHGKSTAWQSGGTRTGDGDIIADTGPGAFWFYVDSGNETVTPPVYQNVTDGTDGIWDQIMSAVRSRILLLQLDGIDDGNVTTHAIVDQAVIKSLNDGDRIVIGPAGGESLQAGSGPMQRDDFSYPILVAHLHAANKRQSEESRKRWFRIRGAIRKAFVNQPLPIADGLVWRCLTTPLEPIVRAWWEENAMVSPQQLVFTSREPRGI